MARLNQHHRQLNAPILVAWIIAAILGLVGILLHYHVVHIPALARHDFLLLVCAFVLLAVASVARGL
jgi:hypothetical protein